MNSDKNTRPQLDQPQNNSWSTTEDLEQQIEKIWCELLSLDRMIPSASFFEIGGDSILAIQATMRARSLGIPMSVTDIFELETARNISKKYAVPQGIQSNYGNVSKIPHPLPMHRRFARWNLENINEFYQSALIKVHRSLDEGFLNQFCDAFSDAHEEVSYIFEVRHNRLQPRLPNYKVNINAGKIQLSKTDIENLRSGESYPKEFETIQNNIRLRTGPNFCVTLICDDQNQSQFLYFTAHHAIVDGVSWRIIHDIVKRSQEQWATGDDISINHPHTNWRDWANQLSNLCNNLPVEELRTHWKKILSAGERICMTKTSADKISSTMRKVETTFTSGQTERIVELSTVLTNKKLDHLLLGILGEAICTTWQLDSFVTLVESHGRDLSKINNRDEQVDSDLNDSIGWFTIVYPFLYNKMEAGGERELGTVIANTAAKLEATPNGGLCYAILTDLYEDSELLELESARLPQFIFNYNGNSGTGSNNELQRRNFPNQWGTKNSSPFLVSVNLTIVNGELTISISHNEHKICAAIIGSLTNNIQELISNLIMKSEDSKDINSTSNNPVLVGFDMPVMQHITDGISDVNAVIPASDIQRGLLYHSSFTGSENIYNVQIIGAVDEVVDINKFKQAWGRTCEKYSALRTKFIGFETEKPICLIMKQATINVRQLPQKTNSQLTHDIDQIALKEKNRRFFYDRAPMCRVLLVSTDGATTKVIITWHHAILDGWSAALVWSNLVTEYKENNNEAIENDDATLINYTRINVSRDKDAATDYWLRDLQESRLSPIKSFLPAIIGKHDISGAHERQQIRKQLTSEVSDRVMQHCRSKRVTLSSYAQLAWASVLSNVTQSDTVAYGITVSGRSDACEGIASASGCFLRTVPKIVQISDKRSLDEHLRLVQQDQLMRDYYSYLGTSEIIKCAPTHRQHLLMESTLICENYPSGGFKNNQGTSWHISGRSDQSHYDYSILVIPNEQIQLVVEYNSEYLPQDHADGIMNKLIRSFEEMYKNTSATNLVGSLK